MAMQSAFPSDASTNRPASGTLWRYALALALAATLCALLLGGLAAWFLGSVAIAGMSAAALTFNFHIPGALVRLFAVGRTAARYGERLVGHKAALVDQAARRVELFRAMASAPAVRLAGWQLGDEAKLADYLDDVEDLDFAKLRVDLPSFTLGIGLAACTAATMVLVPLALLPIGLHLLVVVLVGRRLERSGAQAWDRRRTLQRRAAQRLGMALASAVPLKAEERWEIECHNALAQISKSEETSLPTQRSQASFDMLASMAGPVALLSVLAVAAGWMGLRGQALLVPVFLAFAWLALGETMQGLSRILIARFRRQAAEASVSAWTDVRRDEAANASSVGPIRPAALRHSALHRRAPDGRPIGRPLVLQLEAGRPTVFAGTSGCGKTSLLKQIAGWLGNDVITSDARLLTPRDRQGLTFLCPHDAAIIADTVRANLFAPDASDDEIWDALAVVEMVERIEAAGGLDAWITQDMLSLGEAQRLNLARAWLTDRPIVLLDEPTEHLDVGQGQRILQRLLKHLQDRIVALSSHRAVELPEVATVIL
jgi:ABC-type transport system involved in cytochrome bd biosynthesis fused ATPase/permease subunit